MENLIELLAEYGGHLIVGAIVILTSIFGKDKTAEKIQKTLEKKYEKKKKKLTKTIAIAKKEEKELEEIKAKME